MLASTLGAPMHSLQPSEEAAHGGHCPPGKPIGMMYNHISKTGGSTMKGVLSTVFGGKIQLTSHSPPSKASLASFPPNGALMIQDDGTDLQVTSADAHNYFVIGLVRRPCDFALSNWAYDSDKNRAKGQKQPYDGGSPPYQSANDKTAFEGYLMMENAKGNVNPDYQLSSMTNMLHKRIPDESQVHCWARTHSLVDDVQKCVNQFVGCGGNSTFADWASLKNSKEMASNHAPCSHYFNTTTMKDIMAHEGALISRYNLGSCCS